MITLLGALGEDGGRMHGMQENEVCSARIWRFKFSKPGTKGKDVVTAAAVAVTF